MKKVLGVLALVLSVSSLAIADQEQDTLKEIHFSSELRQSYTDKKTNTGNGLGIAGFKGQNKEKTRWRNVLGGDLNLVDEGNLGLRFEFQNDQDRVKNDFDYQNKKLVTNGVYDKSQTWENDIALYKDVTLGSWTSKWDLGWKYKTTNGSGKYAGHRGKTSGVGANFDLATNGKIFDNGAGNLNYYVTLNNHLRDAKGELTETGKDAKSTVYLDYVTGATYKTPELAGFYGLINTENEWEKQTARHGFKNNFSVWTGLGYKTGIDLSVGTLTVNPEVKYRVVNKETVKGYANDGRYNTDKYTREYNELRAGLNLGLEVK